MDVKGISFSAHHVQQLERGGIAEFDAKRGVSIRLPDQKPSGFWARFQGSVAAPAAGANPPPSKAAVFDALLVHSGVTGTTDGAAAAQFREKFKGAMLDQDVASGARLVLSYQATRSKELADEKGTPSAPLERAAPPMRPHTGPAKSTAELKAKLASLGQSDAQVTNSMKLLRDVIYPKDQAIKEKFLAGKLDAAEIKTLAQRLIDLSN